MPERKEQKLYDTLKRDVVLKLDSGEVDAANAAALAGKLLQLAGGAVYGEDKQVLASTSASSTRWKT